MANLIAYKLNKRNQDCINYKRGFKILKGSNTLIVSRSIFIDESKFFKKKKKKKRGVSFAKLGKAG